MPPSRHPALSGPPSWISFVAGSGAAIVSGAVTHPVDTIKVRLQLTGAQGPCPSMPRPTMMSLATSVVRTEGFYALYYGLSASLLRQATFVGTKFGSYDALKMVTTGGNDLTFMQKTFCGLAAGAIGAAVGNPADLALVRMQADGRLPIEQRRNYRNVTHALTQIVRQEGAATLWRGCLPTVQRAMVVTAAQLAVYDQIKEELLHTGLFVEGVKLHLTSSFGASCVASLTSNPIDLCKTRLMNMKADPATGQMPYRGVMDCAMQTIRSEGLAALWKGSGATLVRQAPLNIVRFVCVEKFKTALDVFHRSPPSTHREGRLTQ
mmetsp:Transcript_31953/g.69774  ORF Transcript_31953/g.69774 Transcript_31953/m.69774 type:complete len:321 (-) Transcript_31953:463-1425(-)|eukprot:CAMPEP_0118937794 /NCGR_PEP_ID=MMETSP1169-20130426/23846_1 /TAXON_ID=36882 /ORGANISM="Pyramimonas obovata, Strain CCMP722" /LENGTH=320 /DNA_ID=CAMNT_0006881545 /DNA_START=113 /DNA_END=1075 /DNA_ORIENTATION=+